MAGYDKPITFTIDYDDVDTADETLKTLLIGALHDEAPDDVTVWDDVPDSIKAQWESTRGLIADWALNNLTVLENPDAPPRVHVNWSARVPAGQIPWGDNPGEGGFFPMGVTLQMEWLDPSSAVPEAPAIP